MLLQVENLTISDVKLLTPKRFDDDRGFFVESYNSARFKVAGILPDFVQDNHSLSINPGTIRGLHYQAPPFAQAKLVRVLRGAVIDVAVDVRRGSPTYGKWVKAHLSAENGAQIFVPAGFLHGFATLAPDTEVSYKVDSHYSAEHDGAVLWNDPDLAIDWELPVSVPDISNKDAQAQRFADFRSPF